MPSHSNNSQKTTEAAFDLILKIRHVDRKFRRARKQIIVLNNRIESLIVRYDRSTQQKRKSFRYATRMQVATVEGVRKMFYEYAKKQCEAMDELQDALKALTGSEYDDFEEFD